MKYRQLTTEQLNEMHHEFSIFLASQKIDAAKWQEIKNTKPKIVEQEINLFSDLVWEKVLTNTKYLINLSKNNINLFRCNLENINRIVIKCNKTDFDFSKTEDYKWFVNNSKDKSLTYFKGQKTYFKEKNIEIFELIEKGCVISNADLYESVFKIIN